MKFVVDWANDVPWENWWRLLQSTHGYCDEDSAPDYKWIWVEHSDGTQTPYLKDSLDGGKSDRLATPMSMNTARGLLVSDKSSIDLALYDLKE